MKGKVLDWIRKKKGLLINVLAIVGLSYMISTGRGKLGVWGFVIFSVLFAGWKLWRGRDVYLRTVRMGSDHLDYMRKARKEKKEKKEKEDESG